MSEEKKEYIPTWSGDLYDKSFFGYHCSLVADDLITLSNIKDNYKILDAGCGTGAVTLKLLNKFDDKVSIDSIDNSEEMLKSLKKV